MANYERDIEWEPAGPSQPLPGSEWLCPTVADLDDVAAYEKSQRQKGEPNDPFEMMRRTGSVALHLESVTLPDGWRYALIKDDQGEEVYDDAQYGGLRSFSGVEIPCVVSAVDNTDLGEGFILKQVATSNAGSNETFLTSNDGLQITMAHEHPSRTVSLVAKERIANDGGLLNLTYWLNPHEQKFQGTLERLDDTATETLSYGGRESSTELSVVEVETGDCTSISFDPHGAVEEIMIAGRYLRNAIDAEPEFGAESEDSQRSLVRMRGAELDDPRARATVADILGTDVVAGKPLSQIRLDGAATLRNVISCINDGTAQKPRETVVLV